MDSPEITIISVIIIFIISFMMAKSKNSKCQKQGEMPFVWGYFQGYVSIIAALVALGVNLLFLAVGIFDGEMWAYTTYALIMGFLGYLVIKRNRWVFIIKTFLGGNLIIWIINGIYIYNRWHEMAAITPEIEVISNDPEYHI